MAYVQSGVGFRGTRGAASGILVSAMLERTEIIPWDADDREKYHVPYSERPLQQKETARQAAKAKRDALAIQQGREPGRIGAPPRLTPDEKEASRIAQNKKRSKRAIARRTKQRAARALAEGRVPGQVGQPRVLTDEERLEHVRANALRHRHANLKNIRAAQAKAGREQRAARATAEGRVPGIIGHLATFTAEELTAYLERWPREKDIYHLRVHQQNARARKLGVPGVLTPMDIREIYIEQAGVCAFCAKPLGDEIPEIDHWTAMVQGGSNTRENIRLLHKPCNRTKGGKPLEAFGLLPLHQMMMADPLPDDCLTQEE